MCTWVRERDKRERRDCSLEVCSFMRAVTTKNHWLCSLNNRNVLAHNSGGWESEI